MKIRGLFPMLEAVNLRQTIEFYTRHPGFECRATYPGDGEIC